MRALFLVLALAACGDDDGPRYERYPQPNPPTPTPGPNPGGSDDWAKLSSEVLVPNCALSGCHLPTGFLGSKAAFIGSKSRARVGNGSMPPQYSPKFGQWNDQLKARVLKYIDENS